MILTISTCLIDVCMHVLIGADYTDGPYSVFFMAGRTAEVFTISLINDNILEVNESFSLAVDSPSLPNNVTSTDQTIIIIIDNDSKPIMIANIVHKHKYEEVSSILWNSSKPF